MRYSLALSAVLLCTLASKVPLATAGDLDGGVLDNKVQHGGLSHVVKTTSTTTEKPYDNKDSFLTRLLENSTKFKGQHLDVPMLVVEVDEVQNDASVKLTHLPIVHRQHSVDVRSKNSNDWSPKYNTDFSEHDDQHLSKDVLPKSRKARDIKFKIYDPAIIQQLIDALKLTDPGRASLLQANIHRVVIKVTIDDDHDDYRADRGFIEFGRQLGLPFARRRRNVEQEQSEVSVKSEEKEKHTDSGSRKDETKDGHSHLKRTLIEKEENREEKQEVKKGESAEEGPKGEQVNKRSKEDKHAHQHAEKEKEQSSKGELKEVNEGNEGE